VTGDEMSGVRTRTVGPSIAEVVIVALVVVLATSPCWGAALIIWVVTR